jgi:acyl CoA:acetate/3-ketoacid CoA transferase
MRHGIGSAAPVQEGECIATAGVVGIGGPDAPLAAPAGRVRGTGAPRNLALPRAAGQRGGRERGLNRLGEHGRRWRVVAGTGA